MKKKEETTWQKALLIVLMLGVSISAIGVSAYFYGKSFREIFILLIIVAICFGAVVFSLIQSTIYNTLHYDNGGHYVRFVVVFFMGTAACCLLPMFTEVEWAVPVIALALSLFSNTVTGILAYAGLLSICMYFGAADMLAFLLYFISGAFFAVLFERLDEEYKTDVPLFIAMITYVIIMATKIVFQSHGMLTEDMLIIPVANILITFILMLAILRIYCAVAIDREKGEYLLINDQEYKMLAKYKEEDKLLYYNAIHTAYFAEKTARLLHMDVDVAKNGGYYHRIIVAECQKQNKTLEEVCKSNKFPPKAVQLLQEFNYRSQPMKMRETVAVYLADYVVTTIMYLISKDQGEKSNVEYAKLATAAVRRKVSSGILNTSDISLADLGGIEKIYTGEKLYYDFLRRE